MWSCNHYDMLTALSGFIYSPPCLLQELVISTCRSYVIFMNFLLSSKYMYTALSALPLLCRSYLIEDYIATFYSFNRPSNHCISDSANKQVSSSSLATISKVHVPVRRNIPGMSMSVRMSLGPLLLLLR